MKPKLIFIMVLLCMAVVGMASAQNMTVSDLGVGGPQTIQIYGINATSDTAALLGTYNTTSNGIPLPAYDFNIVIKPEASNPFSQPGPWLDGAISYVQSNALALILIFAIIGFALSRRV